MQTPEIDSQDSDDDEERDSRSGPADDAALSALRNFLCGNIRRDDPEVEAAFNALYEWARAHFYRLILQQRKYPADLFEPAGACAGPDICAIAAAAFFEKHILPRPAKSGNPMHARPFVTLLKGSVNDGHLHGRLKIKMDWWCKDLVDKKFKDDPRYILADRIRDVLHEDSDRFDNTQKSGNWRDSFWRLKSMPEPAHRTEDEMRAEVFAGRCESIDAAGVMSRHNYRVDHTLLKPVVERILRLAGERMNIIEIRDVIAAKLPFVMEKKPDAPYEENSGPAADPDGPAFSEWFDAPDMEECAERLAEEIRGKNMTAFACSTLRLLTEDRITDSAGLVSKLMAELGMSQSAVYDNLKVLKLMDHKWSAEGDLETYCSTLAGILCKNEKDGRLVRRRKT